MEIFNLRKGRIQKKETRSSGNEIIETPTQRIQISDSREVIETALERVERFEKSEVIEYFSDFEEQQEEPDLSKGQEA